MATPPDVPSFSYWLVCACLFPLLLLFSFWVMLERPWAFESKAPESLLFRALPDSSAKLKPAMALEMLASAKPVRTLSTKLNEDPFWIVVDLPTGAVSPQWLQFPSRHAKDLECWDGGTVTVLGRATSFAQEGRMSPAMGGFALNMQGIQPMSSVVCRTHFVGPARITAQMLTSDEFESAQRLHAHQLGRLQGSLLTLVVLVMTLALIKREPRFILLSVWLILGLRMGQMSAGTDHLWLAHFLPAEDMSLLRRLTIASYFFVTLILHHVALSRVKPAARMPLALRRLVSFASLMLIGLALLLSYRDFLPIMWVMVGLGMIVMLLDIVLAWIGDRQKVAMAYTLAVLAVVVSSAWEIIAAATGVNAGLLNHMTASMIAAFLVVLALAEHLIAETKDKLAAQEKLADVYTHVPVGLFTLAENGDILNYNPAFASLLLDGRSAAEIKLMWTTHFKQEDWNRLISTLRGHTAADLQVKSQNGRIFRVHATRRSGAIDSSLEDVTDRVRYLDRLSYLVEHDALTGALDRRYFEQLLTEQLEEVRSGKLAALASFNLRRFRLVNSLHGLYVGDHVLNLAARRLMEKVPPDSVVARLSGDVFVLICVGRSAEEMNQHVTELLQALIHDPFVVGDRVIPLKATAGLIDLSPDMKVVDAIAGVEYAGRQGTETQPVTLLTADTPALAEWIAQQVLIRSMKNGEGLTGLYLVAQPILSMKTPQQGRNFEVLVRMKNSAGQEVPISRLLSAAEVAGMMPQLDLWVVEHTLQWLDTQAQALQNIDFVCVNLGGTSLNDVNFLAAVTTVLGQYPRVAKLLCLEVTEAVALLDFSRTRHVMENLRSLGVRFALDDFGAGYTSFSYLSELPAEVLKIDGSLIAELSKNPARQAIIAGIARMSEDLGMRCIAEWVDDPNTLDALVEAGIEYAQGFAISRPIEIARLGEVDHCMALVAPGAMRERLLALSAQSAPGIH